MKTEMQVIEQMANIQPKLKDDPFKFEHLTVQQISQWKKQQQQQQQLQLHQQQQALHPSAQQQLQHHQQNVQHQVNY